ncbi:MAG: nitroreductase family protein [Treponema sp.]|jgi:nitroreductase|nr:nitroreductase family protein [Treponema sp.]
MTRKTLFKALLIAGALTLAVGGLNAADVDTQAIGVITGHYSPRVFAPGAISAADLDRILAAAVRSPSAANRQNWHFTVVRDQKLAQRILSNVVEDNILIVVSAPGDGKTNGAAILDCGLATQSIYLAAQALGLGSRIYTGPIDALNARLKRELGLPSGHSAVALVRIGRLPADAVTAASSRKAADSVVSYK